jgi:uncharacterized protein YndB with AHSA1/START domain
LAVNNAGEKRIKALARASSQSVEKHTGKNWDIWIALLKKAGADLFTHKEIVHLLKTKYKITPWWQQIVASGFEIHTGKKIEGQNEKGLYAVTITKTVNCTQKKLWNFLCSEKGLQFWLRPMSEFHLKKGECFEVSGGIFGEVRTIKSPEKVRLRWENMDWDKKSVVQIYLVPREKGRCMLVVQHDQLASPRIKEAQRGYWRQIVDTISLEIKKNLA